jgi:riboflavin kinase/FMN adenylyltransferase
VPSYEFKRNETADLDPSRFVAGRQSVRIFRNMFDAGRAFPAAVVAIGKFDAIHRGHRRVIRLAVKKAKAFKTSSIVVTFDPSADQYMRLYSSRPVLPLAERIEQIGKLGIDGVVLLPFDHKLACLSPEAFAKDVLALQLKPLAICVGEDFCFGKDRAGRVATLQELGPELGFHVYPVPLLLEGGEKISATRIRLLLERGRKREAEKLLGREL